MRYVSRVVCSVCALLYVVAAPLCAGAFAADYPSKPIRLVVPYPPSGAPDLTARVVAQRLSVSLGQPVIIDNHAGSSGIIGTEFVSRSAPDGYTLFLADAGALVINPAIYKNLTFRPVEDFDPISLLVISPFVLVAHPSLHVSTVEGLIAIGKKGDVDYGSAGNGSLAHLTMEWFKSSTGTNFTHVPYKGAASFTAVLAGEVKVLPGSLMALSPYIISKRLIGIAVTSPQRSALMPNLPTVAESGVPGFDASNWFGILAPHGTPKDIITKLNEDLVKIIRSPEMKEHFAKLGSEAVGTSPAEFAKVIQGDLIKWAKVAKDSGAKID